MIIRYLIYTSISLIISADFTMNNHTVQPAIYTSEGNRLLGVIKSIQPKDLGQINKQVCFAFMYL